MVLAPPGVRALPRCGRSTATLFRHTRMVTCAPKLSSASFACRSSGDFTRFPFSSRIKSFAIRPRSRMAPRGRTVVTNAPLVLRRPRARADFFVSFSNLASRMNGRRRSAGAADAELPLRSESRSTGPWRAGAVAVGAAATATGAATAGAEVDSAFLFLASIAA